MPVTINAPGFWNSVIDEVINRKDSKAPIITHGDEDDGFYPQGTGPVTNGPNAADITQRGTPLQFWADTMNDIGVGIESGKIMRNNMIDDIPHDDVLLEAMKQWLQSNQPFPRRLRE